MTTIEQQVAEELRRRAGAMDVPVPHVDRLVEDGESVLVGRRRRAAALTLAAVAAVAGVVTAGPTLIGPDGDADGPAHRGPVPTHTPTPPDGPRSLDDLPQGDPPGVPYLYGGALHVDGRQIATPGNSVLAARDTVIVGRVQDDAARWWVLASGRLAPIPALDGVHGPRLSPRGDLLVWTSYPDPRTTRVVAWDPTTQHEVSHVDLDAPYAECCGGGQQIELLGISRNDAVFWSDAVDSPKSVHRWRAGAGAPEKIGRSADTLTFQRGRPVMSSADALPTGTIADGIVEESAHEVLVDAFVDPRRHYVLRCDTTTQTCERTLPPGRVSEWVFPNLG